MKIVIINGSARKGNTLTAINAFIKGASGKNEIEVIQPDKLDISPCKGCGVCQCNKGCVDQDDTNPTIDKIVAADSIQYELIQRQFDCMAHYLSQDMLFQKSYYATAKDELSKNAGAMEDLEKLGAELAQGKTSLS